MLKMPMQKDDAAELRANIRHFMELTKLNVNEWCRRAAPPVSPSTLYDFLNGNSGDIGHGTLKRLARAAGVTVAMISGEISMDDAAHTMQLIARSNPFDTEMMETIMSLPKRQKPLVLQLLKSLQAAAKPAKEKKIMTGRMK